MVSNNSDTSKEKTRQILVSELPVLRAKVRMTQGAVAEKNWHFTADV